MWSHLNIIVVGRIIAPAKMHTSQYPEPMTISPYMTKGTLKMWLSQGSWGGSVFLDYLAGHSVITRLLAVGEGHSSVSVRWMECVRKTLPHIPVLQMKKDPEPRRRGGLGKQEAPPSGEKVSLEPPGEAQHLDFMPGSLTLDLRPQNCEIINLGTVTRFVVIGCSSSRKLIYIQLGLSGNYRSC